MKDRFPFSSQSRENTERGGGVGLTAITNVANLGFAVNVAAPPHVQPMQSAGRVSHVAGSSLGIRPTLPSTRPGSTWDLQTRPGAARPPATAVHQRPGSLRPAVVSQRPDLAATKSNEQCPAADRLGRPRTERRQLAHPSARSSSTARFGRDGGGCAHPLSSADLALLTVENMLRVVAKTGGEL